MSGDLQEGGISIVGQEIAFVRFVVRGPMARIKYKDRTVLVDMVGQPTLDIFLALPGLAWIQIESAIVEVDRRLEVLDVAKATGHALDLLNLAVEPLAHRVGHR